ncbi:MAG: DUF5011 domain-containing protein, partial [Alteromonadales bacterium]|nr:DUF5011 domain-containing protein [Alteromonadales bacterium]
LNGKDSITLTDSEVYSEEGASAEDNIDGTVTVTESGSVGNAPGRYEITYSAIDNAKNSSSKVRTVTVEADTTPDAFSFDAENEAFLNTAYIVSTEVAGINTAVEVKVTNGKYSVDGGATFTDADGLVNAGDTVILQLISATTISGVSVPSVATLDIGGVTADFTVTTRSTEPSGIFSGTGTVNGGTALTGVKAMIRNEHFVLFDEAERVLYDGNIVSYVGNDFTAEFDVYKNGMIVGGVGAGKVTATGTIDPQNNISFTLTGADYANGTIDVTYNSLFTRPATQNRFAAGYPFTWGGLTNTVNVGQNFGLRAPLDSDQFTGGPAGADRCNYDEGIKTIPDTSINLYQLNWDVQKAAGDPCDHEGTDFQGFATILDMPTPTAGKDGSGTDGIMWFAASNGEFSTFTIFTYQ